uniref:Uncharacterized protein n=1 Tax=Plectus sambesii TaxID=2011161 RepID=A0A914VP11_9BILA
MSNQSSRRPACRRRGDDARGRGALHSSPWPGAQFALAGIESTRRAEQGQTNAQALHECSRPPRFTAVPQVTLIHHASRKYLTGPHSATCPTNAAFGH